MPFLKSCRADLKKLYLEYLDPSRIKREGVFSPAGIESLMRYYPGHRGLDHHKLWFPLVFQMWREKWM